VFFYTLGADYWYDSATYGEMPVQDVAEKYGFGQLTGVDLPGEYPGQVDSPHLRQVQHSLAPQAFPSYYYGVGDNIEMAFGQGETLVTPLQEAVAYGTFATDGTRYAPQVANSIVSPTGKVVKRFKPRVMAHVSLPADTYAQILTGLKGAIYDPNGRLMPPSRATTGSRSRQNRYGHGERGQRRAAHGLVRRLRADDGHSALRRRRRDRPGGLRSGSSRPVARQIFTYLTAHPVGAPDLHPPANAP